MNIQLFEQQQVRPHWDSEQEKWHFPIVDVIAAFTASTPPQAYSRKLKQKLPAEGNESVTNGLALKMPAADGKQHLTDIAGIEPNLQSGATRRLGKQAAEKASARKPDFKQPDQPQTRETA